MISWFKKANSTSHLPIVTVLLLHDASAEYSARDSDILLDPSTRAPPKLSVRSDFSVAWCLLSHAVVQKFELHSLIQDPLHDPPVF